MSEKNKEMNSKEIKDGDKIILNKKRKRNKKEKNIKEKENLDNIIIGNIKIEKGQLRNRIINSYDNVKREKSNIIDYESKNNEKEIKNCEIYINNQKITFTYFYDFPKAGNYIIKYKFKNLLKETNFMFSDCNSLSSLDLSNFNTQNVTNMLGMFYNCRSLTSLNLSNCNTQNVNNMMSMFQNCESLISLDLSNFNTQSVTTMENMFCNCESLTSLNLSNFNTQKVTNMMRMFCN